jgi:hypothetical protein
LLQLRPLYPPHIHGSIFAAAAFRVRICRWKKCSTQSRVGRMNLVSSIPGSRCRRSGLDPLGCATLSPSEGNAPAKQGAENRPPIAYSPLPSADILKNVFENDSTRTWRTSLNPPNAGSWHSVAGAVGGPRHRRVRANERWGVVPQVMRLGAGPLPDAVRLRQMARYRKQQKRYHPTLA